MEATISTPPPPPHDHAVDPLPSEPHEALFLVMSHLRLPDLLTFHRVCRAFRDAVSNDLLLWRDVAVEPPLSWRLTDDALWEVTSRAAGKLTSLKLLGCWGVTDAGVQRVVDANPCIAKLYLPGCTKLTGDCVVRLVTSLTERTHNLKQLRLHELSKVTKEHLEVLNILIQKNCTPQSRKPLSYSQWYSQESKDDNDNPIDIEICPKCDNVSLVFDCTNEDCRSMEDRVTDFCRGCTFCIPRCQECGGCVNFENVFGEETVCSDTICLDCWLPLPKCSTCNRPYCRQHMSLLNLTTEFVCEWCLEYDVVSSHTCD